MVESMNLECLLHEIGKITHNFKCTCVLFGSRVKGNFRNDSDLDIAIFDAEGLEFSQIEEALQESNIPYTMDILCMAILCMDMVGDQSFIQEVLKNGIKV